MADKKYTRTHLKNFIKKNIDDLYIQVDSRFDGMVDCVMPTDQETFRKADKSDRNFTNTYGVNGVWVVGGGRDSINAYDDGEYEGFNVYNCCGSFTVAIKKG